MIGDPQTVFHPFYLVIAFFEAGGIGVSIFGLDGGFIDIFHNQRIFHLRVVLNFISLAVITGRH